MLLSRQKVPRHSGGVGRSSVKASHPEARRTQIQVIEEAVKASREKVAQDSGGNWVPLTDSAGDVVYESTSSTSPLRTSMIETGSARRSVR